jgi:hypothetical protein
MTRKKIANYNSNPDYLDYLTALRKFFTNDADIMPIIFGFNFYINGVYGIPYTDLFRTYDENFESIHGQEKTKLLIDNGTIGIINNQIYKNGGSLITSLETLRIYMLDRSNNYNIAFNPFTNVYSEAPKPIINVLETANPVVTSNGIDNSFAKGGLTQEQVTARIEQERLKAIEDAKKTPKNSQGSTNAPIKPKQIGSGAKGGDTKTTVKQKLNSIFSKLSFLSYKQSKKYKKQQMQTEADKRIKATGDYYNNLNKG